METAETVQEEGSVAEPVDAGKPLRTAEQSRAALRVLLPRKVLQNVLCDSVVVTSSGLFWVISWINDRIPPWQ